VALEFGHTNAPQGVLTVSLSLLNPIPQKSTVILSERSKSKNLLFLSFPTTQRPRLFSGADQPKAASTTAGGRRPLAPPQVAQENQNENVSGK
jgi:hypothetical protein